MRISFDTERLKVMSAALVPDGAEAARWLKRNTLGRVARAYDTMDPKIAEHLLQAQRSFFEAGRAFFEEEMRHADKALQKVRARATQASTTNPVEAPVAESSPAPGHEGTPAGSHAP